MKDDEPEVAVLIVDVSGSAAVYEAQGNAAAAQAMRRVVDDVRRQVEAGGGVFVSSSGDDILCYFTDAATAFEVAPKALRIGEAHGLSVHGGLHWGGVVFLDDDILGQTVNVAARLCDIAKPGELMVSATVQARLSAAQQGELVAVKPVLLKGIRTPLLLYSYQLLGGGPATEIVAADGAAAGPAAAPLEVAVRFGDRAWTMGAGGSLTIGRSKQSDIHVPSPHVSRRHGTLMVSDGLAEYVDHSSTGSVVRMADRQDLVIYRRQVVLSGEGAIILGASLEGPDALWIRFSVH